MPRRTDDEVIRDGLAALDEGLGPVDSLRFVRLTFRLEGDYTADRAAFVDEDALRAGFEELLAEMRSGHQDRDRSTASRSYSSPLGDAGSPEASAVLGKGSVR